jgi:hypothetical protein
MQLPYLRVGQSKDVKRAVVVRAAMLAIFVVFGGSTTAAEPLKADGKPQVVEAARPKVAQLVDSYFAKLPDYRAGDLISQSQIVAVIRRIDAAGGEVKDARAIVERALPDSSFLIRELSSPAGKKFMREVGKQQGAYSRLDRLSTISGGQKIVRDLVREPGGDKLIDYLATTKGGSNLGHTLGGARGGVDLNEPTGRIYTTADLLAALDGAVRKKR